MPRVARHMTIADCLILATRQRGTNWWARREFRTQRTPTRGATMHFFRFIAVLGRAIRWFFRRRHSSAIYHRTPFYPGRRVSQYGTSLFDFPHERETQRGTYERMGQVSRTGQPLVTTTANVVIIYCWVLKNGNENKCRWRSSPLPAIRRCDEMVDREALHTKKHQILI